MSEIMVTGELCYRIAVQTGPVSFVIWDQMAESVKRALANDLELPEVDSWEGAELKNTKINNHL